MPNNTVIVTRPIKEDCNFNAVGNPICYKLRREDYQFNQINDNGGFAQIQINGTDLTAYFQVTETVYIEGLGAATITASSFSTNTLVTVDLTFTATSTGYINNLSKRTDYKIEVEVFDFDTEVSLAQRIVTSPNQAGEVIADISGIVRAFVSANWTQPVLNDVEPETSKKVFIKFQEFFDVTYWDLQTDIANPVIAVFAVMHLLQGSPPDFSRYPHGGNMLLFCPEDNTRKFLAKFNPSIWRGWPFSLSFLWPDILEISRRVKQYNSENTELSDTVTELSAFIASSGPVELLENTEFDDTSVWTNEGAGTDWVISAGALTVSLASGNTKVFTQLITGAGAGDYVLTSERAVSSITFPVDSLNLAYAFYDADDNLLSVTVDFASADGTIPISHSFTTVVPVVKITITASINSGAGIDTSIPFARLSGPTQQLVESVHRMALGDLNAAATKLLVSLEQGGSGVAEITEELTVNVKDPCENPVLLFWKNSRGGDAFWMFDESQDYGYMYPSGRKVRRLILFADNLTRSEWDGLNELNSPTDVIAANIVDYAMDDSIDKTHFRNDNQVFIINQDEQKVGVIVIPAEQKTKTVYKKNAIEITIELPEDFTV